MLNLIKLKFEWIKSLGIAQCCCSNLLGLKIGYLISFFDVIFSKFLFRDFMSLKLIHTVS